MQRLKSEDGIFITHFCSSSPRLTQTRLYSCYCFYCGFYTVVVDSIVKDEKPNNHFFVHNKASSDF